MPTDFRYAWHFVTRTYQCQIQWATTRELMHRWNTGWASGMSHPSAPEYPLMAVGWRDESGMQVRIASDFAGHQRLGDALLGVVNWLMLLAADAQACAEDAGPEQDPVIMEQRPTPGPLPRTVTHVPAIATEISTTT